MNMMSIFALSALIFSAAILYSSVGHAGASGYLAAMALFGLSVNVMKPTALVLNILVATVATAKFYRAGCFSWSLLWPFALTSVPSAFIGGRLSLSSSLYGIIVGIVLLYAALRLATTRYATSTTVKPFPRWAALIAGIVIGFVSGLTGVGGGIFLSPLLLLTSWAGVRQTSGVSAAFILVNSAAGLLGHLSTITALPVSLVIWSPAAVLGGWIGAEYGSRRFDNNRIRRLLAVVLLTAGVKMILA
jgi:uncharacterized membrane protein YfcA